MGRWYLSDARVTDEKELEEVVVLACMHVKEEGVEKKSKVGSERLSRACVSESCRGWAVTPCDTRFHSIHGTASSLLAFTSPRSPSQGVPMSVLGSPTCVQAQDETSYGRLNATMR